MNINDIKNLRYDLKADKLDLIFSMQASLMEKYHDIEKKNGLLIDPDCPVNLHSAKGQFRLKDFAWRITEELGEALEAFEIHPDNPEHYDEELSDALHFLIEFSLLSGHGPNEVSRVTLTDLGVDKLEAMFIGARLSTNLVNQRNFHYLTFQTGKFVEALAKTCNTLKNKPWKQTQMVTDEDYFHACLCDSWIRFINICLTAGLSSKDLFELYFKKHEVNKFRQRSNY